MNKFHWPLTHSLIRYGIVVGVLGTLLLIGWLRVLPLQGRPVDARPAAALPHQTAGHSVNYQITADVFDGGGGRASSAHYQLFDSIGNGIADEWERSAGFTLASGPIPVLYPHQINAQWTPTQTVAYTPYARQTHILTLTNEALHPDVFLFTYVTTDTSRLPAALPGEEGKYSWVTRVPASMTVGGGLSVAVVITVEVPEQETKWVTHTLFLTATSQTYARALTATLQTSTGGVWNGTRWGGCRFDLGRSGRVNFNDVREVYAHIGSTELIYDYGHSERVNFEDTRLIYAHIGMNCNP